MPSDSVLVFRSLSMGDKERWVERLWHDADPTPDTADNELRDEFPEASELREQSLLDVRARMFSDRGRVYIRYGEPDDVKNRAGAGRFQDVGVQPRQDPASVQDDRSPMSGTEPRTIARTRSGPTT
jgi:GWxTD domain-containing protein